MLNRPRARGLLRWGLRLGGTLAFSWFVWRRIDITEAVGTLAAARWPFVALAALAIYPITLLLWARRWHLLLGVFGVGYPFRRVVRLNLMGLFLGFVVADSVGGFVKLAYMREDGVSMPRAVAATFVDKALELAMLLAFGLSGAVVFPSLARSVEAGMALWLAVGVVGLLLAWTLWRRALGFATQRLTRLLSRRVARTLDEAPAQVAAILRTVPPSGWLRLLALSVAVRLAHYAVAYALAVALRIPISYGQIVAVMSVVGIVLALPLSIGGLGTREATLAFLFSFLGLPSEQAVALALLLFLYQMPWRALGLVIWWRNPLGARRTLSPASSTL